MTRETKLGLIVSGSFLALLAALVGRKLLLPESPPAAKSAAVASGKAKKLLPIVKKPAQKKGEPVKPKIIPANLRTVEPLSNVNLPETKPGGGISLPSLPLPDRLSNPENPIVNQPSELLGKIPPLDEKANELLRQKKLSELPPEKVLPGFPEPAVKGKTNILPPANPNLLQIVQKEKETPHPLAKTIPAPPKALPAPPPPVDTKPLTPAPNVLTKNSAKGTDPKSPAIPPPPDSELPKIPIGKLPAAIPPENPVTNVANPLPPLPKAPGKPDIIPPIVKETTKSPVPTKKLAPIVEPQSKPAGLPLPPGGGVANPTIKKPIPIEPKIEAPMPGIGAKPGSTAPPIEVGVPMTKKKPAQTTVRVVEVGEYVVRSANETFESISKSELLSERYGPALLQYNRDFSPKNTNHKKSPPQLKVGEVIMIPPIVELESRYPALTPNNSRLPTIPIQVPDNRNPDLTPQFSGGQISKAPPVKTPLKQPIWKNAGARNGNKYTVGGQGEMLYEIARNTLGNGLRWSEIYRLNPQVDPANRIPAGTVLQLPMTTRVAP